jgi:hypothetical protein
VAAVRVGQVSVRDSYRNPGIVLNDFQPERLVDFAVIYLISLNCNRNELISSAPKVPPLFLNNYLVITA